MHPDQATEPIVDVATVLKKPWAVVPCCVFPTLFPDRKLKNGNSVTVTSEFCDYLQEKVPEAQTHYLAIQGRNKVIYTNPQRMETDQM